MHREIFLKLPEHEFEVGHETQAERFNKENPRIENH